MYIINKFISKNAVDKFLMIWYNKINVFSALSQII